MSARLPDLRRISEAEYEQLCRETRRDFGPEVTAEALLFALCKKVYHHIHGYRRDLTLPYASGPREEVYKAALVRMVGYAQAGPAFDPLEVAGHYIKGI